MSDGILITAIEPIRDGFVIKWAAKGVGFGELTVWMNDDQTIHLDAEYMSDEFVMRVFKTLLTQKKEESK
jgi:hypothetical protein